MNRSPPAVEKKRFVSRGLVRRAPSMAGIEAECMMMSPHHGSALWAIRELPLPAFVASAKAPFFGPSFLEAESGRF